MRHLFFDSWEALFHVAICSTISYIVLFIFIRISGKRSLSKLNAFDFVVTVTLGSTLSAMILKQVPLAEGCVALIIIISLQYLLAWLAMRSKTGEKIINSEPVLLFYDGQFLRDAMKKEVITEGEIYAEMRANRLEQISDVRAVVLELNGEITVVKKSAGAGATSLDEFKDANRD
ncbi:MAG: DUF421 domain-containing protein [Chitinophagaceae bacterium]|nr:MAG: DUF421 domain-containing protein [Chitinophagaceae bacterium]